MYHIPNLTGVISLGRGTPRKARSENGGFGPVLGGKPPPKK